MQLHPLFTLSQVTVSFDAANDWLYVEWAGELTLPVVKRACVELAHCLLERPYPRVLNCNAQVTDVSLEVGAWLACHFMPHLRLAGIRQLAWISSPTLPGLNMMHTVLNWLPKLEVVTFTDLEAAVYWLQRHRPEGTAPSFSVRSADTQAQLARAVVELERKAASRPIHHWV